MDIAREEGAGGAIGCGGGGKQRILVVINNAEALEDEDGAISDLGRMVGEGKVLVTSRNQSSASFVLAFPPAAPLQ